MCEKQGISAVCLISSPAAIPLTLLLQGMLVRPRGPEVAAGLSEVISIQPSHSCQLTAAPNLRKDMRGI